MRPARSAIRRSRAVTAMPAEALRFLLRIVGMRREESSGNRAIPAIRGAPGRSFGGPCCVGAGRGILPLFVGRGAAVPRDVTEG